LIHNNLLLGRYSNNWYEQDHQDQRYRRSFHHSHHGDGHTDTHISVNGFNGAEVSKDLNKAWSIVLDELHHSQGSDKPTLYRPDEQSWTTRSAVGIGGQRRGAMLNGDDFYTELSQQRRRHTDE
jgi:hypothetical protein